MKDHVSLQERLKDLRVEKGLKLEELAEKTGISKSALASYENEENRNKEINHGNLITLADFYEVSIDYLFCRTENREQINTPLSELHLTDEAVALLKSGRINTRLLCEMMSHEKFAELMADAEIYVDGMATMRFHDINSALAAVRAMILEEHPEAAADRSLKILEAGQIEEEDFFCHVTHKTWDAILHDTLIPFYLIFFMVFSPKYSEKRLNCTTYFDLPDFLAPFWHRRILKPIFFCRY